MKFFILIILLFLTTCREQKTAHEELSVNKKEIELKLRDVLDLSLDDKNKEDGLELSNSEKLRLGLLALENEAIEIVEISRKIETIDNKDDINIIKELIILANLIDQLYAIQINPRFYLWERQVDNTGSDLEKEIFSKYKSPWCRFIKNKECNAIASIPVVKKGELFWPEGFLKEDFDLVRTRINADELLYPKCLARYDKEGRLVSTSYNDASETALIFKKIINQMLKITKTAKNKEVTNFFQRQIEIWKNTSCREADNSPGYLIWRDWVLILGAFNWDLDPFGVKKSYEMILGKINSEAKRFESFVSATLQKQKEEYDRLLLDEDFSLEKVSLNYQVVDIWVNSGRANAIASFWPDSPRCPAPDPSIFSDKDINVVSSSPTCLSGKLSAINFDGDEILDNIDLSALVWKLDFLKSWFENMFKNQKILLNSYIKELGLKYEFSKINYQNVQENIKLYSLMIWFLTNDSFEIESKKEMIKTFIGQLVYYSALNHEKAPKIILDWLKFNDSISDDFKSIEIEKIHSSAMVLMGLFDDAQNNNFLKFLKHSDESVQKELFEKLKKEWAARWNLPRYLVVD